MKKNPMISIVILTHDAPAFVKQTILTMSETEYDGKIEIIVVDNKSDRKTKKILKKMHDVGKINKLVFLDKNILFAKGNNLGVKLCDKESDLVLLLNSDVEVKDPKWLQKMVDNYKKGVISLGFVEGNPYSRADGYCFMVDKGLYEKYKLDEDFEWFWSITKLQAMILKDGFTVRAVKNHENLLHHFGGASGGDWHGAKGMDVEMKKVMKWFDGKKVTAVERLD